jgi:hypothetical protein
VVAVLALLVFPVIATAQAPSAAPATARIPETEISPDAAYATWFQIERGTGGDVLWVGRANGRAEDVARVAGSLSAAAVAGAEGSEILAWWPEGLGGVVRRFTGDGSVLPLLETAAPIAAATVSGDGRKVVWATAADDGSIAAVRRRNINRYANQDVGRLAGALPVTGARLFSDRRAGAVVIAGTDPDGATAAWLLAPDTDARSIPVPAGVIAIGLMEQTLVLGTPARDDTAGPPFTFVELASMITTVRDAGEGSHALVTLDGWLAWEAADDDGTRTVMTMGSPADEPKIAWIWDPTTADGDRHLVGATADAGYGGERWAALYPGGLPYHGSDADPVADGGRFAMLPNRGTATTEAILPPVREGRPWAPILASDGPIQIEAAVKVFDGFVAVGRRPGTDGVAMWRSADGTTWRAWRSPIPASLDIGSLHLYARGRTVILAGGENGDAPNRVRIWTSENAGRTWTAVPPGPRFGAGPVGRSELGYANAGVWDVGRLGGRWAVVGMFCVESCRRPILWTSADLRTWTRVLLRPHAGRTPPGYLTGLTIGRDRLLATFWPDEPGAGARLSASVDGRRWTDLGATPDASDGPVVVESRAGLTLVGRTAEDGPLTIWRSRTGKTWEQVHQDDASWGVDDVVVSAGWSPSILVVGSVEVDPGSELRRNAALISANGRPWERSVGWMTPTNSRPDVAVFSGDRQLLALGSSDGGGLPAGWRTELPPDRVPPIVAP